VYFAHEGNTLGMWIHYIGGLGKGDKLIVVAIGLSSDPESQLGILQKVSPFKLQMLGLEEGGSQERLEELRDQFKYARMHGPWFKVTNGLQEHIDGLKDLTPVKSKPKRISLDLPSSEFRDIEEVVNMLGLKTKARFLRKAARFYVRVGRLKAQGWGFQAIKGGKLLQFHDLDDEPDEKG
jgi:hypothetical protein